MGWFTLAICCMIFCSFKSVLAKKLLHNLEPSSFSFFDQLFTMLFVLPFLHAHSLASLDSDFWLMLGASVVPAMLGIVYLSKATKHGQMSDVSPLLIFLPVFVALSGPLWSEDGLSSQAWAGICTVGMGGYFLKLEAWRRPFEPLVKIMSDRAARYVWITVILGVWTTHIQKWMVQAYDAGTALFFTTLGVIICLAPLSFRHAGGLRNLSREASHVWKLLLILGLVSAVSSWSQFQAYNVGGDVATVLSVKRLSVIFVSVYGFTVLRESMSAGKVIGIALMTLGGVVLYYA
ncbi:MAG TPA: EamA family transporter [Oligoflexus sp.]|uniref:EamA family transporter n=1 Tax=Oligoflexus sp. TaxID=1971216 RepID=UPI002D56F792|nr:EamA family transporter [Oligoflexus sp.]HYX34846.1 EamA family transporter [Oligoflexus sp.]